MFRQALSEVRRHPGRFISTLLAIAISVAFLAGSATLVATEGQAQGKAMNVSLAQADVAIKVPEGTEVRGIGAVIGGQAGIAAYAPVLSTSVVVSAGAISQALQLVNVPPDSLRWAVITAGRWPQAADEIVLSAGAARALNVQVGQDLKPAGAEVRLKVVGLTNEPSGLFTKTGYASDAFFDSVGLTAQSAQQWAIKVAAGVQPSTVIAGLNPKLAKLNPDVQAEPAEVVRSKAVARMAGDFDAFANVLWAFAGVSLVVGMITIANTFTITLAQRRRQIGLLRAVGASGAQVRRRFLAEAALLGVLGSLLGLAFGIGLAVAVTSWSTALFWGLALPAGQLAIAFGLGVLATMAAAFAPILRGTRVLPLEALQPALGGDERRMLSVWRILGCGLLLIAGFALAAIAVSSKDENALLIAIGAGALISAGVLFGGPLFVPSLLTVTGLAVRRFGTVSRLAADNAERNPRRATATATALMLAIGLMVTLQVSTASIRATVLDHLQRHYPVDVQVAWTSGDEVLKPIPVAASTRLAQVPGVGATVLLDAGLAKMRNNRDVQLIAYNAGIPAATGLADQVGDGEVLVNTSVAKGMEKTVSIDGSAGSLTLKVVASELPDYGQAIVSPASLAKITSVASDSVMWLSVPNRGDAVNVLVAAADIAESQDRVTGSMVMAALYEQVLNILLAITTGLLAVAVLIALIGVSNTLGLSVLERKRESALLRALGLQAGSLRAMLTIEALQVTVVGVLVGVVAGGFFGWLAVTATGNSGGFDSVSFAVDVPQTLGMIAIAMAAAALASVLPGRRAAKAAPTEALADI